MQAGHELFGVGREAIDLTFGGVTIATSVVAILLGGWAVDRVGSSIRNAMLLNGEHAHQHHAVMQQASERMTGSSLLEAVQGVVKVLVFSTQFCCMAWGFGFRCCQHSQSGQAKPAADAMSCLAVILSEPSLLARQKPPCCLVFGELHTHIQNHAKSGLPQTNRCWVDSKHFPECVWGPTSASFQMK